MKRRSHEHQAEAHNTVIKEASYSQILEVLNNTQGSLTSREIAKAIFSEAHIVSTRMSELVADGRVFTAEKRKCATTNIKVLTFTTNKSIAVNHATFVTVVEGKNQVVSNTNISVDLATGQIKLMHKGLDKGTLDLNDEEVKKMMNKLFSLANKQF